MVSDRRRLEHCALRLDILFFLGYEVAEELPWHSTVSRARQLCPAVVFERLFDHGFAQCVAHGLVAWPATPRPWTRPRSRPTRPLMACGKSSPLA
ncbi:transposase [Hymenobacter terricola]|uniref:transposase n=1 Tax=Hymenobacter terricola TaxID=2819236 RepID=UPI001B30EFAC